jgi:signal transduction histidine kinase
MKKKNALWLILDLIFLVVFNAFFFLLGGSEHGASVWISYGFIHFAYFLLLLTPLLIRKGKSAAIFGFALYSVSSAYFLIAFITGIVFILIAPDSYTAALLVQLCIAGLYAIILITNLIANESTAEAEEQRQHQLSYVKDASAKLKGLLDSVSDKEVKKKIEKVYDAVYSSPIKSHPELSQMENRILQSIGDLESAVSTKNAERIISLSESLLTAINERNRQLKTFN